jgi:hypothetical protein
MGQKGPPTNQRSKYMTHDIMAEPLFEGLKEFFEGLKKSISEAKEGCQTLKDDWLHEDDPLRHAVEALLGIIDVVDGLTENIDPNSWKTSENFQEICRSHRLSVFMANVLGKALKELDYELRYFFHADLLDRPIQKLFMKCLDELRLRECSDDLIECLKDLDPKKWTPPY